jgi:hypothetical protein
VISPIDFVRVLFATFDKSGIADFLRFLNSNHGVQKWIVAADYCLHDRARPNDVFAFTIYPYDDWLEAIQKGIQAAVPRDLKKTKVITADAAEFLLSSRRFHLAFVLEEAPKVFLNDSGDEPLRVARESVALTVDQLIKAGRDAGRIKRLKALKAETQANNFNAELLAEVYLLSYLMTFVSLLIARERPIEVLGWFSDRDNMTTWCDSVVWDLGLENFYGAGSELGIQMPLSTPLVAIDSPDSVSNAMWFDELIRPPDYIAGILSAWDFQKNLIPGDKAKYMSLAQDVVAKADNLVVLKLKYDKLVQCSRLVFNREKTSATPYESR